MLSRREKEMLRWVAAGYNRKQLIRKMSISSRTYDRTMARVRQELGARNGVEAVCKAYALGVLW